MSGGFPLGPDLCNGQSVGANTAASAGTGIPYTTANTKGAFVQLIASTTADAVWMLVNPVWGGAGFSNVFDIAVGAAGSEVVIAPNLIVAFSVSTGYLFPVCIPAGTRISARAQGNTGNRTPLVSVVLFDGALTQMEGAAGVDSIGFQLASSQGTAITASGTANTKGSYSQLIASTARDYMGFIVAVDWNQTNFVSCNFLFDVAIGGAGAEQVIAPNIYFLNVNSNIPQMGPFGPLWINIPAGTRIAARSQASTISASFGLTLYGIYQ